MINANEVTVAGTVPANSAPRGIAFSPDGSFAYATNSVTEGTVTVLPAPSGPQITSGVPWAYTVDAAYSHTVTATGFPDPSFTVSEGLLPTGLTLDPGTGLISGTPTTTGTFVFTITASNGLGADAAAEYTLANSATLAATGGSDLTVLGLLGVGSFAAGLGLLLIRRRRGTAHHWID